MPWPKDPERRAEALAKHRAAQQRRWSSPEERARASERAKAQYADPAARRALSEGVRKTWTPERRAAHRDACRESLAKARRVYAESGKQQPVEPRLGSGVMLRLELIALAAKKRRT